MKHSSLAAFNSFLNQCSLLKRGALLNCLGEKERSLLDSLPKTRGDPCRGFSSAQVILSQIHFSWFAPYLRTLSEKDIRLFLSALMEEQASGLKKMLLLSDGKVTLSPSAKLFLQKTLLDELGYTKSDILPPECLPDTPLNALLNLTFSNLNQLIALLGLHDLAIDMKHIIETAKLKKIQQVLSSTEQNYLKILSQSREPVVFAKMGLAKWGGDEESLKQLISQRGFNRLAKAVYGQDVSFIWYLTHMLEADGAHLFQKLCAPLDHSTALQALIFQVFELLSFMRHSHE
jgi:hypothetical protein